MVMVLILTQWRGHSGAASSVSWVLSGFRKPIFSKKARWPSGPMISTAILAEAMLDENLKSSATFSGRRWAWSSLIVKRSILIGEVASNTLDSVTLPVSSAIAVL